MLEMLIDDLVDIYHKHGNVNVGFLDNDGFFNSLSGISILPEQTTVLTRDLECEDVDDSYIINSGKNNVVLF